MGFILHQSEWEWGKQITIISTDGLAFLRFHIEVLNPTLAHFTIVEVHPSVRRQGRMKVLWREAERIAKEMGCTTIKGYSNPNGIAHKWYLSIGMYPDPNYLQLDEYILLMKQL